MRPRHKTPSIFSLSMVDVMCCALGCFILLWLVNLRDLKQRAREAGEAGQQLAAVRQERDRLVAERTALLREREQLTRDLTAVRGERSALEEEVRRWQSRLAAAEEQLAATQKRLANTEGELRTATADRTKVMAERDRYRKELGDRDRAIADLQGQKNDAEDRLRRKNQAYDEVAKRLTDVGQRLTALAAEVRDKEGLIESLSKRERELTERSRDADKRMARLQSQVDQVPNLEVDLKVYQNKYKAEEALARALEKDVQEKAQTVAALEKKLRDAQAALAASNQELTKAGQQVRALQTETDRVRAAAEARFAGIGLTGRRVVLLVDTSGSMDLVNLKTPDPNKWPEVCRTVGRVLRSLPDVEKFQVIAFAEKVTFPLGGQQGWHDYDAKTSANRVVQALSAVKPEGGTNMYDALQATFRFRPMGLDTVYLFSDGLPNMGEGLPLNNPNLKESEKSEALGKVVRQTLLTDWNRTIAGQPRVRINAVGFFYESPEVGSFLWALTRENDGSFVGMSKP